jgi:hypothetical protein
MVISVRVLLAKSVMIGYAEHSTTERVLVIYDRINHS